MDATTVRPIAVLTLLFLSLSAAVVSCRPSRPLDERSTELSWQQAWILLEDQAAAPGPGGAGGGVIRHDAGAAPRRRITPKSVFVLPDFELCPEGHTPDATGRCVINVDHEKNLLFAVMNFGGQKDAGDYAYDYFSSESPDEPAGPLQFQLGVDDAAEGPVKNAPGQVKDAQSQVTDVQDPIKHAQTQVKNPQDQVKDAQDQVKDAQGHVEDVQGHDVKGAQGQAVRGTGDSAKRKGDAGDLEMVGGQAADVTRKDVIVKGGGSDGVNPVVPLSQKTEATTATQLPPMTETTTDLTFQAPTTIPPRPAQEDQDDHNPHRLQEDEEEVETTTIPPLPLPKAEASGAESGEAEEKGDEDGDLTTTASSTDKGDDIAAVTEGTTTELTIAAATESEETEEAEAEVEQQSDRQQQQALFFLEPAANSEPAHVSKNNESGDGSNNHNGVSTSGNAASVAIELDTPTAVKPSGGGVTTRKQQQQSNATTLLTVNGGYAGAQNTKQEQHQPNPTATTTRNLVRFPPNYDDSEEQSSRRPNLPETTRQHVVFDNFDYYEKPLPFDGSHRNRDRSPIWRQAPWRGTPSSGSSSFRFPRRHDRSETKSFGYRRSSSSGNSYAYSS